MGVKKKILIKDLYNLYKQLVIINKDRYKLIKTIR